MDVMLALPSLLLAVAVAAIPGPGLVPAVVALAIASLPASLRPARPPAIGALPRGYPPPPRPARAR
ncbi:peptide transporter, partial [Pseudomonas putida]